MHFALDDGTDRWGMVTFPGLDGVTVPIEWLLGLILLIAALAWWARRRADRNGSAGIARFARITAIVGAVLVLLAALLVIVAPGQPEEAGVGSLLYGFLLISIVVSIGTPGLIALIIAPGLALGLLWARMRPNDKDRP